MRCPQCDCDNDKVIDSRSVRSGMGVRRRRECLACGRRFSTFESVIPEELKVVKRDGSKEEFNRDKLRVGIVNACYKRDISGEDIDLIVGKSPPDSCAILKKRSTVWRSANVSWKNSANSIRSLSSASLRYTANFRRHLTSSPKSKV